MSTAPSPNPVGETDQLAQNLSGFDPSPAIAAAEQGLLDLINAPNQQTASQLPPQGFEPAPPPPDPDPQDPTNLADLMNQIDPFQLIAPLLSGLGALGTGLFQGIDPTAMLGEISDTIDGTSAPLQQTISSLADDWQGAGGTAAGEKMRALAANGAEVATQFGGLRDNLSAALDTVAQARQQVIAIADEYQAKIAALDLSMPADRAAAVTAANQAIADSTTVMEEAQSTLSALAGHADAIGAPVQIAGAPGIGSLLAPLGAFDPTGVLTTVFSDPRLTAQGVVGNLLDLFFMPRTMTDMNQEIKTMNGRLETTNTRMEELKGAMGDAVPVLKDLKGAMGDAVPVLKGLKGATEDAVPVMKGLKVAMDKATGPLSALPGKLDTAGGLIENNTAELQNGRAEIHANTAEVHTMNETMGPVHDVINSIDHMNDEHHMGKKSD